MPIEKIECLGDEYRMTVEDGIILVHYEAGISDKGLAHLSCSISFQDSSYKQIVDAKYDGATHRLHFSGKIDKLFTLSIIARSAKEIPRPMKESLEGMIGAISEAIDW